MEADDCFEMNELQHELRTARLELNLERSRHAVDMVAKDEDLRKLRLSQLLMQDQIDDLHEQLEEEQARCDGLDAELDAALVSLDQHTADAELAQNHIRTQAREVANLNAELKAMENLTSDSNKLLSEKLALTREMSSLRPEVEHLRAQVEANQGLLAEKLALQRQLSTLQVELDNEKRSAARATAKHGKRAEQDEELRTELEDARKELATEKKSRLRAEAAVAKAEKAAENAHAHLQAQKQEGERAQAKLDTAMKKEVDKSTKENEKLDATIQELRQELEQEKAARRKAEKVGKRGAERNVELEELRIQLEQETKARQRAENSSKKEAREDVAQFVELQKELDVEKRDRKKAEKEFQKKVAELQASKTVLDDKLNAFRDKLRSTKEKLKEKEAELEKVRNSRASAQPSIEPEKPKGARKRLAATAEPESAYLGTPGDGFPAKKAKRATSVTAIGDTSTFSLTPFLNRTGSVQPASPIVEEDEEGIERGDQHDTTPTAPPRKNAKKSAQQASKPLAPSASNKTNAKPPTRKKSVAPSLEMVTEEASEHSVSRDSHENAPITVPLKEADEAGSKSKSMVPKIKPRKSLLSFATFTEEPIVEKKKKRKLGANNSMGKTLFDADEDALPTRPVGSKGILAARALGKSVLGKGQLRPISGGYNMMKTESFTFSPLKKDRRSASLQRN